MGVRGVSNEGHGQQAYTGKGGCKSTKCVSILMDAGVYNGENTFIGTITAPLMGQCKVCVWKVLSMKTLPAFYRDLKHECRLTGVRLYQNINVRVETYYYTGTFKHFTLYEGK